MFDVKFQRRSRLKRSTIFAASPGTISHERDKCLLHGLSRSRCVLAQGDARLGLKD